MTSVKIWDDGTHEHFDENGLCHRDNLPAVYNSVIHIGDDGKPYVEFEIEWWTHGKRVYSISSDDWYDIDKRE